MGEGKEGKRGGERREVEGKGDGGEGVGAREKGKWEGGKGGMGRRGGERREKVEEEGLKGEREGLKGRERGWGPERRERGEGGKGREREGRGAGAILTMRALRVLLQRI